MDMMRVTSGLAQKPCSKLKRVYSGATKSITTTAPTVLSDAMGVSPSAGGLVTLAIGDEAANRVISAYGFLKSMFDLTGNGWVLLGAVSTRYSLTFEPRGMDTFAIPEGMPYYLKSDVAIQDAIVFDGGPHPANPFNRI